VASWVALDLRGLPRHHLQHQQQLHHHNSSINGYDTLTIDSDFYGYAGSTTGSTATDPPTTAGPSEAPTLRILITGNADAKLKSKFGFNFNVMDVKVIIFEKLDNFYLH
jgi:hypothetical protein